VRGQSSHPEACPITYGSVQNLDQVSDGRLRFNCSLSILEAVNAQAGAVE
jgi:hypothetical protein